MGSSSGETPEPTPLFYAPVLGDRPRQGELVADVPWGVIDDPFTVCRPQGKPGSAAFHEVGRLQSAFKKGIETIHARGGRSLAMILWPDCQLDKFMEQGRPEERWFAGVAPVLPLDQVPEDVRRQIRDHTRRMYFYVPANEAIAIAESYVDIRHIWSVKQALLKNRVAAISEDALAALHGKLFNFFTYRALPEACPFCGSKLALSDLATTD